MVKDAAAKCAGSKKTKKARKVKPEPFDKEKLKAIDKNLYCYGSVTNFDECRKQLGLEELGPVLEPVLDVWAGGSVNDRKSKSPELQELLSCLDLADEWYFCCRGNYKEFVSAYRKVQKDYRGNPLAYTDELSSYGEVCDVPLQTGTKAWLDAMPKTVKSRVLRGFGHFDKLPKESCCYGLLSWTKAERALINAVWYYSHHYFPTSEMVFRMTRTAVKKYLISLATKEKKKD